MSNSFSFNAVDMDDYGLVVTGVNLPLTQLASNIQLRDRAYAFDSFRPPIIIEVTVNVVAANYTTLLTYLSSIREKLNWRVDKQLIFDNLSTRYWMARFDNLNGMFNGPTMWDGSIIFICTDPAAYSTTAVSNTHNIDADPKTVTETPGGTDYIYPVYTLTAKEDLGAITLKLENTTTGEEIQWGGSLTTNDYITVNVPTWLVSKNGVASMAGVVAGSKFPRLLFNVANSIKVTGLWDSVTGLLNIAYRNRFL